MTIVVDRELLEAMTLMNPSPPRGSSARGRGGFDVDQWLQDHDIEVLRVGKWNDKDRRWVLQECPWNGHTDSSCYIVQFENGAVAAGCQHDSCQSYGWPEMREHYEPGCYDRRGPGTSTDGHGDADSSLSDAMPTKLPPVPAFPTRALRPRLRRIVEEAAASIGCPPEFIAVPMLGALGAAIGNSHVLKIKGGWTESAGVYAAVVADPGQKKTPAFKVAMRPVWNRQAILLREYRKDVAEYPDQHSRWEDEKEQARDNGQPEPPEPEKPVMRRTAVDDTTVEALVNREEVNPRGLIVGKDELSAFVKGMNQYKAGGKGSDQQVYLSMWSGSPIAVDRKGGDVPIIIPLPFVCVVGSIQPQILPELKNNRDDGFVDRFLLAYPDPVYSRYNDNEISDEAVEGYQEIYDGLYNLEMEVDENGDPVPKRLEFARNAKEIWVNEVDSLREEMEHPQFPQYLTGPWAKLEAYLGRLTLIMALVRIAGRGDSGRVFSSNMVIKQDVRAAADLVAYFKAHARRVHAKLNGDKPQNLLAASLKGFLREQGGRWEGMTEVLYGIFRARSAPGLPRGPVPFGKMIREIARQDDALSLTEAYRGSSPIIVLSLSTLDTAAHEGNVDADAESTEGTEGKSEAEHAGTGSGDTMGSSTGSGSFSQDSNLGDSDAPVWTDADDDVETEADRAWLLEVERVLRRHVAERPEHVTAAPSFLIAEGVFRELDRDPTPGEVEEAQCRILGV